MSASLKRNIRIACVAFETNLPAKGAVEFGPTEKIFTKPDQKRTEDYITGRFG